MKSFLEEYGFAILVAIVVILLITISNPLGNVIKSSITNIVERLGGTVASKTLMKEDNKAVLSGTAVTVVSESTTDRFVAILHGVQGGREVSVVSNNQGKLLCTDNMTNVANFDDTSSSYQGVFTIEGLEKLDKNSNYYVEVLNVGNGYKFKTNTSIVKETAGNNTIDLTNINVAGVIGDFSAKGNLVTINSTQYRVLAVNETQVKVMSMVNIGNSAFNSSSVTTSFGGTIGQKYAGSVLDGEMTNFYNSLPAELQNAIVEQNISQSMYKYLSGTNYYLTRTAEINVGARKIFALDVDDVISYLGSTLTAEDVNELFFDTRSNVSRIVWLRSASSAGSSSVFSADGGGYLYHYGFGNSYEVHPAFVLDLSLLS